MPVAVGHIRYGPRSLSVARKAWWSILECSRSWHYLYAAWARDAAPGRWANVVDPLRIIDSKYRDLTPRLAVVKPGIQEPAWKPHISITRGEKPTKNLELWNLGVKVGDGEALIHKWVTLARKVGVPEDFAPGKPIEFGFDPDPKTGTEHWWFDVECEALKDFRGHFGLRREPRVEFHLTFAVRQG